MTFRIIVNSIIKILVLNFRSNFEILLLSFLFSFKNQLYFRRPLTTSVTLRTRSVGSRRRMNSWRKLWPMVSITLHVCNIIICVKYLWYLKIDVPLLRLRICVMLSTCYPPQASLECRATAVLQPLPTPAPSPHRAAMTRRATLDILHIPTSSSLYIKPHPPHPSPTHRVTIFQFTSPPPPKKTYAHKYSRMPVMKQVLLVVCSQLSLMTAWTPTCPC